MMYFRYFVIFIFLTYSSICAQAQKLPIIGVPSFSYEEPVTSNLANHVTEHILSLLKSSGRYMVVDMTSEMQRQQALERAQENYKAENWLDSYKALNAEIILGGEITSIKFVKSSDQVRPGYRAAITLTLKLIAVETSEITAATNFATKTSELRLTPETALSSSLDGIQNEILAFFKEHVNSIFPIVKINAVKSNQVESFTCIIPLAFTPKPGNKYRIVYYELLGDKRIPVSIGEARISRHIAEDFWLMNVTKGGKEVFNFIDNLEDLLCSEL